MMMVRLLLKARQTRLQASLTCVLLLIGTMTANDRYNRLLEAYRVAVSKGNSFLAGNILKVIKEEFPGQKMTEIS